MEMQTTRDYFAGDFNAVGLFFGIPRDARGETDPIEALRRTVGRNDKRTQKT